MPQRSRLQALSLVLALVVPTAGRAASPSATSESPTSDAEVSAETTSDATGGNTSTTAAPTAAVPRDATIEARGLDARVRRLTDGLAREMKRMPGEWRDATYAVMRFSDVGPEAAERQLGLVVSDLVITNLVRDHRLRVTERGALEAILDEAALSQLGITDGDGASRIGQVAGARALVLGEVADVGASFRVSTRLIDVTTGEARAAFDEEVPKAELIALSADAVVLKSRSGAFFRSLVAPGWGQTYNGDVGTATLVGGTVVALAASTVALLAAGAVTHVLYATWSADNIPPGSTLTKEQQIEQLQGLLRAAGVLYTLAGVSGALLGVTWLAGAFEAYISGVDVESVDRARLVE